jgi:hypothetical protein
MIGGPVPAGPGCREQVPLESRAAQDRLRLASDHSCIGPTDGVRPSADASRQPMTKGGSVLRGVAFELGHDDLPPRRCVPPRVIPTSRIPQDSRWRA